MTVAFFFTNRGSRDLWICLSGPTARSSDCLHVKPNTQNVRLHYVATKGFDQPYGEWTCNVFSSQEDCDLTFDTIASAEVGVDGGHDSAFVSWFFGENGFETPAAKVSYSADEVDQ